jgi:hypothetical protein
MRNLCSNQAIHGLDVVHIDDLISVFPKFFRNTITNEIPQSLYLLHSATNKLDTVDSFAVESIIGISTLAPFFKMYFLPRQWKT